MGLDHTPGRRGNGLMYKNGPPFYRRTEVIPFEDNVCLYALLNNP